jgi:thiosulfate dehydrogenase [quinone] large subunit
MTQRGAYILTAISAGLYLFLTWAFADGLFGFDTHGIHTDTFWVSEEYSASVVFTYLMLAAIVVAGVRYARSLPAEGAPEAAVAEPIPGEVRDPVLWQRLLGSVSLALVWLPLRFFIGREWVSAGEHKIRDSAWMDGGSALQGYWQRAVDIPDEGRPAITYGWYREFLQYMLDNEWYTWFAKLIAVGEFVLGLALIVGALVGISAFIGTFMNFNFQLAGSASSNPVLFALSVFLVLGWKVAGYFGVDRYLLPALGAPWRPGRLFVHEQPEERRTAATTSA